MEGLVFFNLLSKKPRHKKGEIKREDQAHVPIF